MASPLLLCALLLAAGLLAPATSRQLQQTAASGPRHRRSLQQIGTAPNLLVATAPAAIQPAVTDAAAVPAVQLPTLPGQQPAGTAVAIPVSINSTASTTTTPNNNVATLGTSNSTNPTAVPTAAAPGVVAPNIANSTVPAATLQPQAPPGFLPPGFGPAAVQQQVQQGATNMDPASGSLAASPLATPAVPATAGTVSTAAAGMTAVAPPAAEQSAWSAGIEQEAAVQQEAGIAVQEQPLSGVQEAAELTPGTIAPPSQQTAWSAGWAAHPDDNDLLLSSDDDHQNESAVLEQGSIQVTILHFNDWHVRVEPTKESYCALCSKWDVEQGRCNGGLARMSTFVKQQRQLDPNLLLLNAGDDFIGTEWDRKAWIDAPAAFMNMLGVDAVTVGNHEWDKGLDTLKKYIDKLNTTKEAVLGANVNFGGHELQDKIGRYVVKEVKGKRVCILGLTTQYGLPSNDVMWPIIIEEPYHAGREVLKELEQEGCHATVLLSHLGYTSDLVAAKALSGLDVVIGGHSHSFLWGDQYNPPAYYVGDGDTKKDETWGPYPTFVHSNGRDVPVVQASWGSRYMGKLVLTFDPEDKGGKCSDVKGEVFLLGGPNSDTHVEEDPQALDEIKRWRTW